MRPTHPNPDMRLRFNWNAAIGQDPFDNSTVYFGSQFVHKSKDKGLTWEVISPDLTTNDPENRNRAKVEGLPWMLQVQKTTVLYWLSNLPFTKRFTLDGFR